MEPLSTKIHQLLAKSDTLVKLAVKARNQCSAVLRESMTDGIDPVSNGEAALVKAIWGESLSFVDVGANKGQWIALARAFHPDLFRCLCFEPNPVLAEVLERLYSGIPGIEIARQGLGDAPAFLPFHIDARFDELSSFAERESDNASGGISVEVTTLAVALSRRDWEKVDLLKIDCEGFDAKVLRGAGPYLKEGKIRFLQFEYSGMWARAGETLFSALKFLRSMGYETALLKGSGLIPFDYEIAGEFFGYSNFVSARKADLEELAGRFSRR